MLDQCAFMGRVIKELRHAPAMLAMDRQARQVDSAHHHDWSPPAAHGSFRVLGGATI